jgi:hypothetical protein
VFSSPERAARLAAGSFPQLIDAGHDAVGTHTAPTSAQLLRTLGAKPVMVDLLDPGAVRTAVLKSEPEAIVHQATALANAKFSRNMDKTLAKTNELRTKGTDGCWRPRARPGCVASLRRALPPTGTPGWADRSTPRTIRLRQPHRPTCNRSSPR